MVTICELMFVSFSLFHRAFFNSIMHKTPTHAVLQYYSIAATTPDLTIEILNSVF